MVKFTCEKCGEVDKILVDGYSVGDRLLEDVWFIVTNKKGKISVKIRDDCKEYFEDLNKRKWLEAVKEFVLDGADEAVCYKCKNEVGIENEKPKSISICLGKPLDGIELMQEIQKLSEGRNNKEEN